MAKLDLHAPLSETAARWLLSIANPVERCAPHLRPPAASEIAPVLHAAELHGVLPVALRALRTDQTDEQARNAEQAIAAARQRQIHQTGLELLLRHHGEIILRTLQAAGISAAMLKGPIFARRLYAEPAMRSFRDIDILIPLRARETSRRLISRHGFELEAPDYRAGKDYCEDKWSLADDPKVRIEVHSDLVHNPKLRRTASITLDAVIDAGNADPDDATAILFVASAHGAISHQLDRLQHLADITLAANGAAGEIDVERLSRIARACGVLTAVHAGLVVAGTAFGLPRAHEMAKALEPSPLARVASRLVPPSVVLEAQSNRRGHSSWRRKALRQAIRLGGAWRR